MASELKRIKKRKEARGELEKLYEKSEQVFLIHYSCESFYDIKDGRTPRVTSIALRNLKTAQTESFSIHKVAERRNVDISDIPEKYDTLEKEMLADFFEYIKYRQNFSYIHWNMRDGNYGFSAIEHRFQVLGGEPLQVQDEKKFDLARAIIDIFGRNYIDHGDCGRFISLVNYNNMTSKGMLTGKEEANAFDSAEYVKLHQSTLRKVDAMSNIVERVVDDSLLTCATWKDKYGFHPKAIVEYVKEHWLWSLIAISAVLIGLVARVQQWF
ncbi:hypothetical protein NHG92_18850 [Vibrio cholerae]|uniref:hypothetical protein n=1 Tax=Vibrio cholerae TaxID=666 RepID=UPI002A12D076|nr:hypothetical protein [Vibrio cholerae]EKF9853954.1 hypothetical protein [Vibrio cholerae]ELY5216463.1 hypothetical protein [Vibrio cholerae]